MSDNKYLKFEEGDEYKETLDRELERLNNGEISKNEFLEKFINRRETRENMSLEEYKNLPLADHKQQMLDAAKLEKSGLKYLKATLGPYRLSERMPNIREDGTGFGGIIIGQLRDKDVVFKIKMIDVIA